MHAVHRVSLELTAADNNVGADEGDRGYVDLECRP